MNVLRRLRRLTAGRDAGFTLTELMVTMVLLSLVMSMSLLAVRSLNKQILNTNTRVDSTNIASVGMNNISKAVRAASEIQVNNGANLPAFVSIGSEAVTFYSNLGAGPVRVAYSINANRELVESRTLGVYVATPAAGNPYWTFAGATSNRLVARKIPAGLATPIFTYYDGADATVPVPSTSAAVLSTVETVKITLTVQALSTTKAAPVTLVNRIALPNLGIAKR
ncbi:MAG: hypothetical protein QOE19_2989 [Actinomycetota bacterium]|nr:hypothetical protein [Actinomycetota bacterium]MDQ1666853.1 hypothetical protein [Actinomycetota bacterium]